jgi:cell division protein FtsW
MRKHSLSHSAYVLLGATCVLVFGGLLAVYSASSVADYVKYGDSAYHLKKQAQYALLGVGALWALSHWKFGRRRGVSTPRVEAVAWLVWGVSVVGLIAVEVSGVGKWGATRSIDLGIAYVQPSEYAKLGALLVTAALMVGWQRGEYELGAFLGRLGVALGVPVLLIMMQPDMGTTMSLVIACGIVIVLGGVKWRWLFLTAGVALPSIGLAILLAGYRMERLMAFIDPWADPTGGGYQFIQSLYAFGSGGPFGVGLGLSRQKFFYLPAAHNDFIFAVIGEETGLVGALGVVVAFIVFAYAGIRIALECKDPFGRLLAGGLTGMIVTQAIMNMAAVTGLMPITGIPLPLVSAGGSSLTLTLAAIGLILAVSRHGARGNVRLVRPEESRESDRASATQWRRNGGAHLPRANGRSTSGGRRA